MIFRYPVFFKFYPYYGRTLCISSIKNINKVKMGLVSYQVISVLVLYILFILFQFDRSVGQNRHSLRWA
jgi:hypothetical protein